MLVWIFVYIFMPSSSQFTLHQTEHTRLFLLVFILNLISSYEGIKEHSYTHHYPQYTSHFGERIPIETANNQLFFIASMTSPFRLYLSASFCKVVRWTPDNLFGTNYYFLLHAHSAFSALRNSFEMNKWCIYWEGKRITHIHDVMVVNLP